MTKRVMRTCGGAVALGLFFAAFAPAPARASLSPEAIAAQSAVGCYEEAREQTGLNQQQARALCRGVGQDGPVTCFVAADRRTLLSDWPGIKLCRCAMGSAPVDCYEKATEDTDLTEHQAVRSCSPIVVRNLTADCVPRR